MYYFFFSTKMTEHLRFRSSESILVEYSIGVLGREEVKIEVYQDKCCELLNYNEIFVKLIIL